MQGLLLLLWCAVGQRNDSAGLVTETSAWQNFQRKASTLSFWCEWRQSYDSVKLSAVTAHHRNRKRQRRVFHCCLDACRASAITAFGLALLHHASENKSQRHGVPSCFEEWRWTEFSLRDKTSPRWQFVAGSAIRATSNAEEKLEWK